MTPPKPELGEGMMEEKLDEEEEDVMRRRGRRRHKKGRDSSRGPPEFQTSADPETQVD